MIPALYLRPDTRTGTATGTPGSVSPNMFSPRLLHWPWEQNSVSNTGPFYFLGPAEFPLGEAPLPSKMWDFARVKEWRVTGTFVDSTYSGGRPDMSRTMTEVFAAGTIRHQGWYPTALDPFDTTVGTAWANNNALVRSNGFVEGYPFYTAAPTASIQITEQEPYLPEGEEDTEYYYAHLGVSIGRPMLFRPLLEADVPVGGTLEEWGWVLPIRAGSLLTPTPIDVVGDFGNVDIGGGSSAGAEITYNGVAVASGSAGDWTIELTEETYF